jgi:DNA-binding transcriptional ArsR family regulator
MKGRVRTPARARTTLAQLKALADPLRYRIFENLIGEARTARQMAEQMGTHPTRLYHHFDVLKTAGLIRAAGTRRKRGTVEKYFEAVVDRIDAAPSSARTTAALVPALVEGVLDSTRADMEDAVERRAGPPEGARAYLKRYRIRATPQQAATIRAKLEALAELCEKAAASDGADEFGVTLAFYRMTTSPKRGKGPGGPDAAQRLRNADVDRRRPRSRARPI